MGYDVGVYKSCAHRTIPCSGFLRFSESEPCGVRGEIVGYPQALMEIVRSPCDVREESLRFLTAIAVSLQ